MSRERPIRVMVVLLTTAINNCCIPKELKSSTKLIYIWSYYIGLLQYYSFLVYWMIHIQWMSTNLGREVLKGWYPKPEIKSHLHYLSACLLRLSLHRENDSYPMLSLHFPTKPRKLLVFLIKQYKIWKSPEKFSNNLFKFKSVEQYAP